MNSYRKVTDYGNKELCQSGGKRKAMALVFKPLMLHVVQRTHELSSCTYQIEQVCGRNGFPAMRKFNCH